jgi:hypothetical protein
LRLGCFKKRIAGGIAGRGQNRAYLGVLRADSAQRKSLATIEITRLFKWWSHRGSNLPKTVKPLQFRERSKTPSPLVFRIVFKLLFYECSFYLLKNSKNQKIFKR